MNRRDDPSEFYVGYEPLMPRGIACIVRRAVIAVGICAMLTAAIVLPAQRTLPDARFEFGRYRGYTGGISLAPYPRLLVAEGTGTGVYWLVGPGKHGAEKMVEGWAGRVVRLQGALIERGGTRMLEVRPGSIGPADDNPVLPDGTPAVPLGIVTLHGEIVDGKCFFGVMNPSEGAVHRDCAVACLRGGLPAMLRVRNGGRRDTLVALVTTDGASGSRSLAALAGRLVEVSGALSREGRDYVLAVQSVVALR